MDLNSITGDVGAFKLQPLNSAASGEQPVKGTPVLQDQTSQPVKPSLVDANAGARISPVHQQISGGGSDSSKKPVRSMSDVVEVYNLQGKVRTKFMDSNNNVIYQIPTEMVAKMEDQMKKSESSTNIKG